MFIVYSTSKTCGSFFDLTRELEATRIAFRCWCFKQKVHVCNMYNVNQYKIYYKHNTALERTVDGRRWAEWSSDRGRRLTFPLIRASTRHIVGLLVILCVSFSIAGHPPLTLLSASTRCPAKTRTTPLNSALWYKNIVVPSKAVTWRTSADVLFSLSSDLRREPLSADVLLIVLRVRLFSAARLRLTLLSACTRCPANTNITRISSALVSGFIGF